MAAGGLAAGRVAGIEGVDGLTGGSKKLKMNMSSQLLF